MNKELIEKIIAYNYNEYGAEYGDKILKKQDKEIERLKEENKKYNKWIESLNKDNHRLNNIIKEVRELLKNDYFEDGSFTNQDKVFEILDKGE